MSNFNTNINLILERLSAEIYHSTDLSKLLNILTTNKFNLVTSFGQGADELSPKNKSYYMSFTRSRTGEYHYPTYKEGSQKVLLVLDGDKLSNRYEGKSVDYWGPDFKKDEMEDRLFSNKPEIDNATSYIKEIHCFSAEPDSNEYKKLRQAYIEASKRNTPLYFYKDSKSFDLLDKRKSVALTTVKPIEVDEYKPYTSRRRNYFAGYMELLSVKPDAVLSKAAKASLGKIEDSNWDMRKKEWIISISNEIHNDKRNPERKKYGDRLIQKLNSLGIKNFNDMHDHIMDKFKNKIVN